ncbi:unnamed protein product, partial [Brachionus calyciflorus]
MNFVNRVRENPNLKGKIEQLGYEQSNFHTAYQFHKWYKKMFKLNYQMQKRYDEFLKRLKPNSNSKLICCQIRKGDPHQQYVKLDAKNYFKNNEVIYNVNSSIHIDTELNNNECNKMESVIFDFHVMQNCDIGLVSHSGYGILALHNRPDPFKDFYTIPLGLAGSLPYILSSHKFLYADQGTFSFTFWPFSLKLLCAPLIDSIFIKKFGRRKSWLVPIQYLLGIYFSFYANELIENDRFYGN